MTDDAPADFSPDEEASGASDPRRIVVDADVLAADLLVGGTARDAMDAIRDHSWLVLLASDELLADARHVIARLATESLADDWYSCIETERTPVDHPAGDHPALASAYRGGAAHLLTFDDTLTSAGTNLSIQPHASLSIRTPGSFVAVFDAESLYESTHEGTYPGPDRDA
jgi:predicted nucleic acid-binding protein